VIQGKPLLASSPVNFKSRPIPPSDYTNKFKAIKAAIPKHCFKHSYLTSFRYLFVDLAVSAVLFYAVSFLEQMPLHPAASLLLYCPFFQLQCCCGIFMTCG
jgi:hypothetical protein